MAQQLTALGQEVSVLVLIDSYLPRTSQGLPRLSLDLILTKMMREYGLDLSPHALNKLKGHSRLNGLLDRVKAAGHIPATFTPAEFRKLLLRYARVFRANVRAMRGYLAQVCPVRVVHIRAADSTATSPPVPKVDWRTLAAQVSFHSVPGDHYSILREPYVNELAERLGNSLQAAVAEPTGKCHRSPERSAAG